jgi:hypothetical protein
MRAAVVAASGVGSGGCLGRCFCVYRFPFAGDGVWLVGDSGDSSRCVCG